jgi:hypothetical protein
MRRTIQSTYHMFKDHPNFDSIKFVLSPNAHETLLAVADLPSEDFLKRISDYALDFPKGLDTSLIQP